MARIMLKCSALQYPRRVTPYLNHSLFKFAPTLYHLQYPRRVTPYLNPAIKFQATNAVPLAVPSTGHALSQLVSAGVQAAITALAVPSTGHALSQQKGYIVQVSKAGLAVPSTGHALSQLLYAIYRNDMCRYLQYPRRVTPYLNQWLESFKRQWEALAVPSTGHALSQRQWR